MFVAVSAGQGRRFKVGWVLLLASAGLMTLNHFLLVFVLTEPTLFIGWAAFTLYSLVVIAIPFRQHERWTWFATWILPIGLAAGGVTAPDIGIFYFTVAAACVLGLLLTMREFFAVDR